MFEVAGGILIAVVVLFLLPVLLPLAAFALLALGGIAVVVVIIVLALLTGTEQVLGVLILGWLALAVFGAWSSSPEKGRQRENSRPIPKVGTRAHLDWANREGEYAEEKEPRGDHPSRPRTGNSIAQFVIRWIYRV